MDGLGTRYPISPKIGTPKNWDFWIFPRFFWTWYFQKIGTWAFLSDKGFPKNWDSNQILIKIIFGPYVIRIFGPVNFRLGLKFMILVMNSGLKLGLDYQGRKMRLEH